MPLEDDDQKRVDEAITEAGVEGSTKLLVLNASESQKLGPVTVICMILNRTVGQLLHRTSLGSTCIDYSSQGPAFTSRQSSCLRVQAASAPLSSSGP